jgi:hypothetical protein
MHRVRNPEIDEQELVTITPHVPANWYSVEGAFKKFKLLEKKGLPSFKDWRFLTLTVDNDKFKSGKSAYEYIKPRLRFFIRRLKQYLNSNDLQYCWKLEFQQNGYPHWHLLINYKKIISVRDIYQIWANGYVDIKRIESKNLPYVFKYCAKSLDGLPHWFLEYNRPRVFQSSGLFVSSSDPDWSVSDNEDVEEVKLKTSASSPETLGDRLKRYKNSVNIRKNGKTIKTVNVFCSFGTFLVSAFQYKFTKFINAYCIEIPNNQIQLLT